MNAILASTSTVHGSDYLAYLEDTLKKHYKNCKEILFIPFARPSGLTHDEYTEKARKGLHFLNAKITGIHEKENKKEALKNADGIFTGGGNTFLLVTQLYQHDLLKTLQEVIVSGTPYLGTSAGSNICGKTMMTTNDMPIIYPPSFDTMSIVPFNLNVHYLDPNPDSTHKGETRETRIKEFQNLNNISVVGLREGSWLNVSSDDITLGGPLKARVFIPQKEAYEIEPQNSLKGIGV